MTKGKKSKKKSLKLRRQIRKTAGALFMASAIVVAAIPVQDIEAETIELIADSEEDASVFKLNYNPDDKTHDIAQPASAPSLKPPSDATVTKPVYYLKEVDGQWTINWQFKYTVATSGSGQGAIISKYNNMFDEETVTIGSFSNVEYEEVLQSAYESFINSTNNANIHTVTYSDYESYKGNMGRPDIKWVARFRGNFITDCEDYEKALAQYNIDHEKWAQDQQANPDPTKPEPKKSDYAALLKYYDDATDTYGSPTLSFTPNSSDLSDSDKYAYYCYNTPAISGKGEFTLVSVLNIEDGKFKLLIRTITGEAAEGTDENGFLLKQAVESQVVIGIAEQAFKEVRNVKTLILPSNLKYIGDEAFLSSFIETIKISNVEVIGNRAFKGCNSLMEVSIENTLKIGAGCFSGSSISNIKLPVSLTEIGYGAFAECLTLTTIDFSALNVNSSCKIDDYAFYNNPMLSNINMDSAGVISMGEGALALSTNPGAGSFTEIKLPNKITGASGSTLGSGLLAGRNNLKYVKFPDNYGTTADHAVTLPKGMFMNCASLELVDFTAAAGSKLNGYVSFETDTFKDVTNEAFYIKGPELNYANGTASPRTSTWDVKTTNLDSVPYCYINSNGVECYEVSQGNYLLQANANGELTSCELRDPNIPVGTLTIPERVGNYDITSIMNGCFKDETLRNSIQKIIIKDNSIKTLDDSVFEGLPNLEKVEIGNSVQSIGKRAFADCKNLIDVTFHPPLAGYEGFTIGDEAFTTNSNELTFRGDILPGYEPFDFATGAESSKIDAEGKRICYKSLSPDFLTVMYDNNTGDVTLLDYPKYNELDNRNKDYCKAMEEYYTKKYGSEQSAYDSHREEFAKAWTEASDDDRTSVYDSVFYGPWIDDTYVKMNGGFDQYLQDAGISGFTDKPSSFYSRQENKYSIINNYERGNTARGEYEAVTDEELRWINSALNVVIPAGITSIDAASFFNATENARNINTYFGRDDEGYSSLQMCTKSTEDSIPGLFSGYYEDYDADSEFEKEIKGNDGILSVTMTDVKFLPDYAFDSCERLQNVTLGDDCAEIGKAPFRGCDSLTDVTGNEFYVTGNRIIYSVNEDGTYTIEECLPSRGRNNSSPVVLLESDPNLANVSNINEGAFENCDFITRVYLDDATKLKTIPKNCFNNCENLISVSLPTSVNRIADKAFAGNERIEVTIPGKEVHIVSDAFEHVSTNTIRTYKGTSADDYGQYHNMHVEYLSDSYTVDFLDHDGTKLCETQYIEEGKSAVAPEIPVHEGFTFKEWSKDFTNVTSNLVVVAICTDNSAAENMHTVTFYAYDGKTEIGKQQVPHNGAAMAPAAPERSGYKFVAWVPGTYTNVTADLSVVATYEKDDSSSGKGTASPSVSPTPTASPSSDASSKKYTVSVSGGSGSGEYAAGAIVSINAYALGTGQVFDKWTTSTAGVGFADATSTSTTFTMPAANVAITATYKTGNGTDTAAGGNGTSGTNGTNGNGTNTAGNGSASTGTTVEVTKPGISNTGLAGATVTGATDNFVVKITEDEAATQAAIAALQAKYGDISRIKYLPMDISLYDSTGRTKIADTTGISVNITLPLPDDLAEYAGNNKMASAAGNTLDDLNTMFTTVDGVPCINFTATHFSPYVVYVDTANLTEATIDATPKTGDPIHPKWFLATGLACVALILFFKRDRAVIPAKTA